MATKEELAVFSRYDKDLAEFAVNIFGTYLTDTIPPFHFDLYKLLPKEERLVVAAPRGFAKSMICSVVYVAWLAIFKHRKDICIISASEGLAIDLLRKVKMEIENNQKLLHIFGDMRSDKWTENHIILTNGVNIRAKGAGAQIRGFRPDCLVLDDIETDESVESEEQRKKLKDWLFRACINCLLPKGQLVVVGTIIHPLSLLADLLETPNGWKKLKLRAYIDNIEDEEHALWKSARPHVWLQQRKKEIGSFAFASEYMNDPKMDSAAVIKPENIRYWTELPKQYNAVIAVDPAYSEEEKSDWKVASLVLCDHNGNRYVAKYIRTHDTTLEFIDAFLNMYLANKGSVQAIGVPNSGTEKLFYSTCLKRAEERKINAPFVELTNSFTTQGGNTVRKKKDRICAAIQYLFEQGKYYIHESMYELRDELLTIGSSRWDDLVDSLAYAEQIITPDYREPKQFNFDDAGYLIEDEPRADNYGI